MHMCYSVKKNKSLVAARFAVLLTVFLFGFRCCCYCCCCVWFYCYYFSSLTFCRRRSQTESTMTTTTTNHIIFSLRSRQQIFTWAQRPDIQVKTENSSNREFMKYWSRLPILHQHVTFVRRRCRSSGRKKLCRPTLIKCTHTITADLTPELFSCSFSRSLFVKGPNKRFNIHFTVSWN